MNLNRRELLKSASFLAAVPFGLPEAAVSAQAEAARVIAEWLQTRFPA